MIKAIEVLEKAREEKISLGAFNVGNLAIAKAVIEEAQERNTPVIVQMSPNETEYFGMDNFLDVVSNLRQKADVPIITNLDHGADLISCQKAIEAGFDMVHFDGSSLPYEENVKIAKILVEEAHSKDVLVEGELDKILGSSEVHDQGGEITQDFYTDPRMASEFVSATGIDTLAVFVGNKHGTYPDPLRIDLLRLEEIRKSTSCFLCLHGGSGVEAQDIKKASCFVNKINVNTELRIAYKETLENVLRGTDDLAIYKIMPPVIAAVKRVVGEKIDLFSCQELKAQEKVQEETQEEFQNIGKNLGEDYEI